MNQTKPWYTSLTVWANVFTILAGAGMSIGVAIGHEVPAGIATALTGLVGIVGRTIATKQIGSTPTNT